MRLALGYSAIAFPVTGGLAYYLARRIWKTLLRLGDSRIVDPAEVRLMRRRAVRMASWGTLLSALGWLPGAVLLPLLLRYLVPDCGGDMLVHYFLCFLIAGLIALTYTEFADQFLILAVAYPQLWVDPKTPRETARAELECVGRRLQLFQVLAGLVPLAAGVALMLGLVAAAPQQRMSESYHWFLLLVTLLMALGMAGSWLAVVISSRLRHTLAALTGTEREV